MSTVDPNGWVTDPPSQTSIVVVRVVGTSRDAINGKLGRVAQWMDDKGRYLVQINNNSNNPNDMFSFLSLKPDNLVKASFWEQLQFQRVTLMAVARSQLSQSPYYHKAQRYNQRFRAVLRQYLGDTVASYIGTILAVLFLALILSWYWSKPRSPYPTTGASSASMMVNENNVLAREHYYQLGYDDGTQFKPFGTSLNIPKEGEQPRRTEGVGAGTSSSYDPVYDEDFSFTRPPRPRGSSFGGMRQMGTLMSAGYVFTTLKSLGQRGDQWSFDQFRASFSTLPAMRQFMLAFSVYNIFKAAKTMLLD